MRELTVLCVDADEAERAATSDALAADDEVAMTAAGSVAAAGDALDAGGVDCVVTAYDLPDGTGLDVAARIRETTPDTPCILFTDASPDRIDTADREDVVVEYLPRDMPDARDALARMVGNLVSQRTQVGYPLPTREDERLAALEQYDRPGMDAAEAFDRLTALTRKYFDVDVAFVGVIDAHEERFLACAGASWETLAREDSMCTHTILRDDLMVVEDTHEDDRFADNDRLDELNIRAYAGVPLETPRGATIGAFCLTHDEPRTFTDDELADLRRFAAEAMDQLELRRQLNECEDARDTADHEGAGLGDDGGDDP
ncbi:GAF domain-containing protein [Halosimplex carlsbadense 2-9-1]|uniref:GAF domain-containing protein n=1 Tax=Halosimplex carlsbadense 2-9-1 TaxID=797114 RepID=M0D261_9EURY|nr:GAF domain-containing protein [Halosimplex carlsbadense]ELZ29586.1 GAF domain-containing protein [Halosimplex carlsbadense 2-9-1]